MKFRGFNNKIKKKKRRSYNLKMNFITEPSTNHIKETSGSGFFPEQPPPEQFFGKRQGAPVCPSEAPGSAKAMDHGCEQEGAVQGPCRHCTVRLSWVQTGENLHEGFVMIFALQPAPTSYWRPFIPFPFPHHSAEGGPPSSCSGF